MGGGKGEGDYVNLFNSFAIICTNIKTPELREVCTLKLGFSEQNSWNEKKKVDKGYMDIVLPI
jgi:hypothetical protein